MTTSAPKSRSTPGHGTLPTAALVLACEGDRCTLRHGADGTVEARRAASCLLLPAPGDTVACLHVAPGALWIVAVLERAEGAPQVLRLNGDTRLEVKDGRLELEALELAMRAQSASLTAGSAELSARHVRLVGTAVKVVGSALSTFFDRVTHFSRFHLRTTEGVDRTHATQLECEAEQILRLSSQHTLVDGQKLVKARGAQIHFG